MQTPGWFFEITDLSITINRTNLNEIMMEAKTFDELKKMLSTFTIEFELLPGTLEKKAEEPVSEHLLSRLHRQTLQVVDTSLSKFI